VCINWERAYYQSRFVMPPARRTANCPFCDSVHIVASPAPGLTIPGSGTTASTYHLIFDITAYIS